MKTYFVIAAFMVGCIHTLPAHEPATAPEFHSMYAEGGFLPGSGMGSINLDGPGATSGAPVFTGLVSGNRFTCGATATGPCYDAPSLADSQYVYKLPGTNNGWFMSSSSSVLNLNMGGSSVFQVSAAGVSTGAAIDITAGHSFITNSGTGGVAVTGSGGVYQMTNMFTKNTAPTISSGFGTSPSIVASNGSLAFQVNVGTGGVATSGVIGLPTAANGWVCKCDDITTENTTVTYTKQTASSTTTCTVANFTDIAGSGAWVASDKLNCIAVAY